MTEEKKAEILRKVNAAFDCADAVSGDFKPTREKIVFIESPRIPGPIILTLLRASAAMVKEGVDEYCVSFGAYTDEMGLRRIDLRSFSTLEEAEALISHFQEVSELERGTVTDAV